MLLLGLTGSIATGKSTVASVLSSAPYNLPIIDADLLARQVVAPGTRAYTEIVEYFGTKLGTKDLFLEPTTATTAGAAAAAATTTSSLFSSPLRPLNRTTLGRLVFGSTPSALKNRAMLNRITHPRVRLAMVRLVLYYYIRGHAAVVLDIPLLYESGLDIFCGAILMVAVRDPEVQMRRLMERDVKIAPATTRGGGGAKTEIEVDKRRRKENASNRINSQSPIAEKVGRTLARGPRRGAIVWNDTDGIEALRAEVARVVEEVMVPFSPPLFSSPPPSYPSASSPPSHSSTRDSGLPSPSPRISWYHMWLWTSPLAAALVAGTEVWSGWRARRMWEASKEAAEVVGAANARRKGD